MQEPVSVDILGHSILVKSPHGEEAVKKVVLDLEERIEEVRKTNGTVDSFRLLLYTVFQVVDENIKRKEEMNRLEEEVDIVSSRMIEIVESEQG